MYIVLEYYLLENFIINFFILLITKYISKTNIKTIRIIIGSLIGTSYSLVLFYPPLLFITSYPMKLLFSIIIVKLIYRAKDIKSFTQQLLCFYIVSFVMAGIITSLSWDRKISFIIIEGKAKFANAFQAKYLGLGVLLAGIIIYRVFTYNYKINLRDKYIYDVDICLNQEMVSLKALVDTGNLLLEPLSKKPVFIVEYKILRDLLPANLQEIYHSKTDSDYLLIQDKWEKLNEGMEFRIIPFKSLGSKGQIILGFKPDYVKIYANDGEIIRDNLVIGIYNGNLVTDRGYRGLLSHELMIGGNNVEKAKV